MKIYVVLMLMFSALVFNCNRVENIPEIRLNKYDQNTVRDTSEKNVEVEKESKDKNNSVQIISSKEVKAHIGDSLKVKGYVADIFLSEKVVYLNFENKFPKNTFSCAIFSGKFDEFGDVSKFKNKTVEVTGKVSSYKNKPQVILYSKDQIKIITDE